MKYFIHILVIIGVMFQACNGCSGISVTGDANAGDDEVEDALIDSDVVVEPEQEDTVEPEPGCTDDGECDDLDPCSEDSCNMDSGTCLNEPLDADDDGFPAAEIDGISCGGTDCDDLDETVHPGAEEIDCDGVDNDCDGSMSPIEDEDRDGYVNAACAVEGQEIDCDDTDDSIYPGAPLQCDGLDHDCSGRPDRDEDEDGYWSEELCSGEGDDCDDTRADVYPGAPEVCLDGIDQDCDGLVDGPMLMIPKVMISDRADLDLVISMAWSGSEFGIAWSNGHFIRVSADGVPVEGELSMGFDPSMVWTGSEYVIAYTEVRGVPPEYVFDIFLKRINADGIEIEDRISLTDNDYSWRPIAAWTGSELGVAFLYYGGATFLLASPDGSHVSEFLYSSGGWDHDLAWGESIFGLVWETVSNVFFNWISADGIETGSELALIPDEANADAPKIEWTGSEFIIVWEDFRSGTHKIGFTRVSSEGEEVTDDILLIDSESWDAYPTLEWTGSEFGMTFQHEGGYEGYNTYFILVGAMGDVIGEKIEISDVGTAHWNEATTQLAWTGSEFGVAWVEGEGWTPDLYFSRIGLCE